MALSKQRRSAVSPRSDGQVNIEGVACGFDGTLVLENLDLQIGAGEFLTLLGPSGSGKTTLLRVIAGLIDPDRGRVVVDGKDITHLPAQDRDLGFVFQNYALFPHLTVQQNVEFPLKIRRVPVKERRRQAGEMLDLVALGGLGSRFPSQLSGGQQQRVALARALVHQPRVLLLDEPLGALDRRLRQELGRELRRIQRETATTAIYVTHDQEEAFVLSDRVGIMKDGVLAQLGAPLELYRNPSDLFVAAFLGDVNIVRGILAAGSAGLVIGDATLESTGDAGSARPGDETTGIIRPEHIAVVPDGSSFPPEFASLTRATVLDAYFLGQSFRLKLAWSQGELTADVDASGFLPAAGDDVQVGVRRHASTLVGG